jgi:glycosyltransferase involved in cell wall biosynthesis
MSRPNTALVVVNNGYRDQRVTGQQRYAHEIFSRLSTNDNFAGIEPEGAWAGSTMRVWAWVQLVLPRAERGSVLLSMTARAPLMRRRQVLVVHDLFVLTNPEWFSRRYAWSHAALLRSQLRSAAALVAVSQPAADQLSATYHRPVAVAPNAASEVFKRRDDIDEEDVIPALREHGLLAGSYFLTVGNLEPRKNLARLAAAYGQLDDALRARFPLVVVGATNSIYRTEERAWPRETVDAGYVSDDELRQLYRGAHTVVMVSQAEGFGLPLVEAAAAGARQLLVSDIEVFRWICGTGARYVDPASTDSIAAGLLSCVESPPLGLTIDPNRFSWESSARVIRDVCLDVARSS